MQAIDCSRQPCGNKTTDSSGRCHFHLHDRSIIEPPAALVRPPRSSVGVERVDERLEDAEISVTNASEYGIEESVDCKDCGSPSPLTGLSERELDTVNGSLPHYRSFVTTHSCSSHLIPKRMKAIATIYGRSS